MKKVITPYKDLVEKVAGLFIRVSSFRQEDQGSSLETQKDMCYRFAEQNNIRIKKVFCDSYESAKSPGEDFKYMIEEALKDEEINIILVQSLDRFSRNAEGIVAREILKSHGKYLISITQQYDPDTPEGDLMSDISLSFAKYENAVRQCKILLGQKGQLLRGEWPYQIPLGYIRNPAVRKEILIDKVNGNLMKQAFQWRAEGVPQVTICERLTAQGCDMRPKHLSKLLKNPFYIGWIIHENLDNVPMKGIHPAIIDEDTFFAINKGMRHRIYGTPTEWDYVDEIGNNEDRVTKLTPEYPLKRLIHCPHCGKSLTGYETKRLEHIHHYYKCSTRGCGVNIKVDDLHCQFDQLINHYQLDSKYIPLLRNVLKNEVRTRLAEDINNLPLLRKQYSELEHQKTNVDVNLAMEKISDTTYQIAMSRISDRMKTLDEQIYSAEQAERQSEDMMKYVIDMGRHQVSELIREADYKDRLRLQSLIFPEGLEITSDAKERLAAKKVCPIFRRTKSMA